MFTGIGFTALVVVFFLGVLCGRADAYLDPGTGSYIVQMIIAGVVGAAFAMKLYWTKIKAFLMAHFGKSRKPEEDNSDDESG